MASSLTGIVDAWIQHATRRMLEQPMFDSLRRWSGSDYAPRDVPLEETIAALNEGGVRTGLMCAWWGPAGPLISNDEVASFVARYPDRLIGIGGSLAAHGGHPGTAALRSAARLSRPADPPLQRVAIRAGLTLPRVD